MKSNTLRVLFSLVLSIALFSCGKDDKVEDTLLDESAFSQESLASNAEKALSDDVDALTLKTLVMDCNFSIGGTCAIVTEDSETFPKTITINYGNGCTDFQGRTKTGKIFIHLTDEFINSGAIRTVTFENFSINGVGIAGTRVTTNQGYNAGNQMTFNRIINTTISYSGSNFQRNFDEDIIWISGFDNEICGDNVISITGDGSVTRPNGVVIPRSIVAPLIFDQSCGSIISGTIEVYSLQGLWSINYGSGECDNSFTVTRPNGSVSTHTF